ncbi:hypothetical protein [Frondihabitans sp. VKM Ac-2883]|uniref:hypothetical protein n=1 Tax=Frondihabitans sp. VKM Ac-2883 TaxID=2783823 RepID=UPI00188DB78B|nr:hypothetical protein [Frondihabitans sp. VKM Ac-2883]MBF4575047.1 hypothetical protein [Frondihabitans sp. VKM Ac-2883]
MSYISAAKHADEAANQADAAAMMRNNGEPDRAFECLSFAVVELAKAVADLARAEHQSND